MLEVKRSLGSIIKRKVEGKNYSEYLDQLDDSEEIWVTSGKLIKYLKDKYQLSVEEYYNLILYNNKDQKHYCEICGKEITEFQGMWRGYYGTCSLKCSGKHTFNKLDSEGRCYMKTPEFAQIKKEVIKNMFDSGTHPFQTVEVHARSRREDFINKSTNMGRTTAWLYKATLINDSTRFKIGVTCDMDNYFGLKNLHGYLDMEELKCGTVKDIAELEYQIKLHFDQSIEYYDMSRLDEVLEFIREYNI